MQSWLLENYFWVKSFHVIAIISWMAGMLYLPRLFAYHAGATEQPVKDTFVVMERRLVKIIMVPAMVLTFIFGALMLYANPDLLSQPWMHIKLTAVFFMYGLHGVFSKWRKKLAAGENTKSPKFYKIWNEVPTALMIIIVIMAVAKPF